MRRKYSLNSIPFWVKIAAPCAIAAVIVFILFYANGIKNSNRDSNDVINISNPITVPDVEDEEMPVDIVEQEEEPLITEQELIIDENGFAWRVAPELEYDKIYSCGGFFSNERHSGDGIDTKTGLTIEYTHQGHGGGPRYLFYDEKRNLFGFYTSQEDGEFFDMLSADDFMLDGSSTALNYAQRLNAFLKIDSDKVKKSTNEWDMDIYDLSDANISKKYAIAYGITFVSDFIYDYIDVWEEGDFSNYYANNIIAMIFDGKWGILDKGGEVAVPFSFEDILLIDEETAFAKINGKYGILDVNATTESLRENNSN